MKNTLSMHKWQKSNFLHLMAFWLETGEPQINSSFYPVSRFNVVKIQKDLSTRTPPCQNSSKT